MRDITEGVFLLTQTRFTPQVHDIVQTARNKENRPAEADGSAPYLNINLMQVNLLGHICGYVFHEIHIILSLKKFYDWKYRCSY